MGRKQHTRLERQAGQPWLMDTPSNGGGAEFASPGQRLYRIHRLARCRVIQIWLRAFGIANQGCISPVYPEGSTPCVPMEQCEVSAATDLKWGPSLILEGPNLNDFQSGTYHATYTRFCA
jgi:hypothetical protein